MIQKLASNTNKFAGTEPMEDRSYEKISLKLIDQFNEGQITGYTYEITNVTSSAIDLAEEAFCLPGDIAVCLLRTHLEPGQTSELYIVRKRTSEDQSPLS